MTATLELIQKQNGLNLQYDPLETPEGSYSVADNVWANREGLLESRRGLERFGAAAADRIDTQFEFDGRLLRHDDSGNLEYDSTGAGVFATYAGTFLKPAASVRMRNVEIREQNFITTSKGVFSQDSLTDAPARAGIEPFLELTITLAGTGLPSGPLTPDSQTGYRAIWGRENDNLRTLRGAPSEQERITSPLHASTYTSAAAVITVTTPSNHGYSIGDTVEISSADDSALDGFWVLTAVTATTFTFTAGGAPTPASGNLSAGKHWNASIEFPIPDDVVAGDWYRVYRTLPSADQTSVPGEEHYLVKEEVVTAGDIVAGTITYVDSTPDSLLDKESLLYTNPSLGSSARPNDRPPYCVDICEYKGHAHFAGAKWEEERQITLKDLTNLVSGTSYLEFGGERYVFAGAENVGLKQFKLFSTTTTAENIRDTMKSLVRVVNRASAVYYAFYVSGVSGAPGKVVIRHRALNGSSFDFVADLTATGDSFEPAIPTASSTLMSDAPGGDNVLARSKFEQPEAVPRLSTEPVGSETHAIERILELKEVMVILKNLDGFHAQTGNSDGTVGNTFKIKGRDPKLHIYGRDTAAVLGNRVFCYTSQGFVAISEYDAAIVGREVEKKLATIRATTDWDSLAFAVAYETEDMYHCFGPEASTDTECVLAWTYNNLNEKFVNGYRKRCSAGHVLSSDDKTYLAHADDDFSLQERKSIDETGTDYMDESVSATITAVSTTTNPDGDTVTLLTVTYTYAGADLIDGFVIEQGALWSEVAAVTSLGGTSYSLELNELIAGYANGAATMYIPILVKLKTVPLVGKGVATLKQYSETHIEFENDRAFSHYVSLETDFVPGENFNDRPFSTLPPNAGWGLSEWGGSWGDPGDVASTPLIIPHEKDYCRARRLMITYYHHVARERVSLSQITVPYRETGIRSSNKASS